MSNEVALRRLTYIAFRNTCIHIDKYPLTGNDRGNFSCNCFLKEIPYYDSAGFHRNLCFAIWHEDLIDPHLIKKLSEEATVKPKNKFELLDIE